MPTVLRRACKSFGCPNDSETCPTHGRKAQQQQVNRERGSSTAQGYGKDWEAFRQWHMDECFRLEVPRAGLCGARLPGTPETTDSDCAIHGYVVPARVLDHIVPITGKADPSRLSPTAVQWLCDGTTGRGCHDRKRQQERGR